MKRFFTKTGIWLLAAAATIAVVLCVVSAAHTGAALRMHNKGYGACQTGGREGRPYA